MPQRLKLTNLDIDGHTGCVGIVILLVLMLAVWLMLTNKKRNNFDDVDLQPEYEKLANSLAHINIAKIKYNLIH